MSKLKLRIISHPDYLGKGLFEIPESFATVTANALWHTIYGRAYHPDCVDRLTVNGVFVRDVDKSTPLRLLPYYENKDEKPCRVTARQVICGNNPGYCTYRKRHSQCPK